MTESGHIPATGLQCHNLLAQVSAGLTTHQPGQMDQAIENTQRMVCEILGTDRSTLWQSTEESEAFTLTHFWQKPGYVPLRRNFPKHSQLPWTAEKVRRGESFHVSNLANLPPEAARDVEALRAQGTKSYAVFPLSSDGVTFGAITFSMVSKERDWTVEEISSLAHVAGIFGHVICRKRAEQRADQLRMEIRRAAKASALGEAAATLAHEINQPLTSILSNAQAARRFLLQGEAKSDELLAILDDIIRDDKRADGVIRNLRSMISDTPAPHELQDINELLKETGAFLSAELARASVGLQLETDPTQPRIRVARTEIQQLLTNLILNAVHAMDEIPPERRRIVIRTSTSGQSVTVRVMDHGDGIPQEHMDRIFEPFHTTRAVGLGMGLAICRRIALAHGGTLEAHNTQSAGAEFTLTLPLHGGR